MEFLYDGAVALFTDWKALLMIAIGCVLIYLAIKKNMEPALLLRVDSAAGVNRETFTPRAYRTATTAANAEILTGYMRAVVTGGTGKKAAVDGLTICGKTGSAESSLDGKDVTHGWFVGFIDDAALPYAVAVVVESIDDGEGGGSTAAPIAGQIFTYLRDNAARVAPRARTDE